MKYYISLFCAILLCSCSGRQQQTNKSGSSPIAKVEQGILDIIVNVSGEIQSAKSQTIIPELKTVGTIEFIVEEGDKVTNNQVVARFNSEDIENNILEIETKIADQKSKLASLKTDVIIQKLDNNKNFKTAKQAVSNAKLELKKLEQGDAPLEQRNAELKIKTSERERDMLKRRISDLKGLLKDGFVTEDQVEEEDIAYDKSVVAADTAREELIILNKYSLPLRETKTKNTLAEAETELEKIKQSNTARLQQKEQTVNSAEHALEKLQQQLKDKKEQLNACIVTSPADGIVTYADPNRPWRRTEVSVGAKIAPGQTLMTIPDMSAMHAKVDVPESDIRKIKLNQSVTVTVEATGGKTFTGKVTKIAEVAKSGGWWGSDIKEFSVEISIDTGKGLKPGYSCRADILAQHLENIIYIPIQAVFKDKDGTFVYKQKGNKHKRINVKTGQSSLTMVEILDGLKKGDSVLLSKPE
jgi:HlyD family secretion protein